MIPAIFIATIAAAANANRRNGELSDVPRIQCRNVDAAILRGFFEYVIFLLIVTALFFALLALTGCATTEKLAEGIAVKNVSGNGTFAKNSIGLNPETKIPEISSIFVSGDYSSAKSGTNSILYRSESTGSLWNAKVVTKKQFVSITLVDTGDVGDVIRAVSEVLRAANPGEEETIEENP